MEEDLRADHVRAHPPSLHHLPRPILGLAAPLLQIVDQEITLNDTWEAEPKSRNLSRMLEQWVLSGSSGLATSSSSSSSLCFRPQLLSTQWLVLMRPSRLLSRRS
ncbi:hypothetical protein ACJRO7_033869 [Eucalyptus globulus]|uniref:Uncharacterized protein n=1 Tax=Eucalyptus globulus TaxID=34317 RepID=A0ABD3J9F7_EUCGL